MRIYAANGRRQRALAQFHLLRASLRRELEDEPDDETRRLYQSILTRSPGTENPPESAPSTRSADALAHEQGAGKAAAAMGGASKRRHLAAAVASQHHIVRQQRLEPREVALLNRCEERARQLVALLPRRGEARPSLLGVLATRLAQSC